MNKEKNKTKEEILDGLNIITPLNELEGQEVYSREEVLAAMEEYAQQFQSKENEGKQAGFTDAIDFAEWIRENEYESHGNRWVEPWHTNQKLYDTQQLYNLFRGQPIVESGERGEVERLKGLIENIFKANEEMALDIMEPRDNIEKNWQKFKASHNL